MSTPFLYDDPAIELLAELVSFPSLSHEEQAVADYVEAYAREAGLDVHRLKNNVWFTLGEGDDRLLLNSHLDVVPPSAEHPYDPFTPTVVDGMMYGRGTVDAKASGATMTRAVVDLAREGWQPANGQVIVALTACEETGGTYNGLEELRPSLPPLSAAIVGEPTQLQPCVAQKGLLILNVHAHGQTAHAARAHLGDNAILRAARDIQKIAKMEFDREDAFLGSPTVTVTTIEGGTARNVVPDRCSFTLDIRSTPAFSHDELTEIIAGQLESAVQVHSKRIVPVKTDVSSRIVQACLAAKPDAEPFGSPTASDWIFLSDVPAVKLGPGPSERSHTADEHIELDEVVRAVGVYKDIIRAYFESGTSA